MIELKDGDYVLGVWFVGSCFGDVMITAWREAGAESFRCKIRRREKKDALLNPWLTEDRKDWWRIRLDGVDEAGVIEVASDAAMASYAYYKVRGGTPTQPEVVMVRGGPDKFMRMMRAASFAHFFEEPAQG